MIKKTKAWHSNLSESGKSLVGCVSASTLASLAWMGGITALAYSPIFEKDVISDVSSQILESNIQGHAAYMGGVASGLVLNGVHIDENTLSTARQIEEKILDDEIAGQFEVIRLEGISAAMDGTVTADNFVRYVDYVASLSDTYERIVFSGISALNDTIDLDEGADRLVKLTVAAALSGQDTDIADTLSGEQENSLPESSVQVLAKIFSDVRDVSKQGRDYAHIPDDALRAMAVERLTALDRALENDADVVDVFSEKQDLSNEASQAAKDSMSQEL